MNHDSSLLINLEKRSEPQKISNGLKLNYAGSYFIKLMYIYMFFRFCTYMLRSTKNVPCGCCLHYETADQISSSLS